MCKRNHLVLLVIVKAFFEEYIIDWTKLDTKRLDYAAIFFVGCYRTISIQNDLLVYAVVCDEITEFLGILNFIDFRRYQCRLRTFRRRASLDGDQLCAMSLAKSGFIYLEHGGENLILCPFCFNFFYYDQVNDENSCIHAERCPYAARAWDQHGNNNLDIMNLTVDIEDREIYRNVNNLHNLPFFYSERTRPINFNASLWSVSLRNFNEFQNIPSRENQIASTLSVAQNVNSPNLVHQESNTNVAASFSVIPLSDHNVTPDNVMTQSTSTHRYLVRDSSSGFTISNTVSAASDLSSVFSSATSEIHFIKTSASNSEESPSFLSCAATPSPVVPFNGHALVTATSTVVEAQATSTVSTNCTSDLISTTISSAAVRQILSTAVTQISSIAVGQISSTAIGQISSTAVTQTLSTAVAQISSTAVRQTSSTAVAQIASIAVGQISSTAAGQISSAAATQISSAAVRQRSSTSVTQTVSDTNKNSAKGNAGGPTYSDLGIVTERPKRIEYAVLLKRMETFLSWPRDHHLRPSELAEAGFYYAGYGDCARCFYCGGGLRNWKDEDDIWVQHARWFPKCPFIRQQRGQVFVDTVQKLSESYDRINSSMVMEKMGNTVPASQFDRKETPLKRDPAVKIVVEMGFPYEQVIATAEKIKQSENTLSADTLCEKLVSDNIKRGPNASKKFDLKLAKVKNESPSRDAEKRRALKEKIEQLREQTLCKICMDKEVAVDFLPCGHFVSCTDCAAAMKDCPVCRKVVKGIVRAYFC